MMPSRVLAFLAGAAIVVLLASCSANRGSSGPPAGSSRPAGAPRTSAAPPLVAPVGRAPTIRILGNHFVDGHGAEIRLLGVNFAGVEGACVDPGFQQGATDQHPGAVFDYQGPNPVVAPGEPDQPAEAFFATLAGWHVNAVRFLVNEMCWLGRPPNPGNNPAVAPIPQAHYSAAKYRQAIETFVASLHRYGMIAVPALGDNPCPRNGLNPPGSQYSPCGDNQQVMPDAANAPDFWRSFASTFKNDHSMVFELFNEPHPEAVRPDINVLGCWRNGCQIPGEGWRAAGMQQLIDAIRSSGATQPILVPGINYSAVLYRPAGQGLTTPVGWLTPGIRPTDTLNPPQLAASNHMYDNSYDSTDLGCPHGSTPDCWDNRLGIIAARVPLVTTELGEHDCGHSAKFIDSYMNWADTKPASGRDRVSYLAWTFNADYSCNDVNTTLITDWSGTPNVAGRALRAHLIKNNGR
jgi:hypothetical protein